MAMNELETLLYGISDKSLKELETASNLRTLVSLKEDCLKFFSCYLKNRDLGNYWDVWCHIQELNRTQDPEKKRELARYCFKTFLDFGAPEKIYLDSGLNRPEIRKIGKAIREDCNLVPIFESLRQKVEDHLEQKIYHGDTADCDSLSKILATEAKRREHHCPSS